MRRFRRLGRTRGRPGIAEVNELGELVYTPVIDDPAGEDSPMGRTPQQNPFGPFEDPDLAARAKKLGADFEKPVEHDVSITFDARASADWVTVLRKDTAGFTWGMIQIDVQAVASPTVQPTRDKSNYCEVRIIGWVINTASILLEQACAGRQNLNELMSTGPIRFTFRPGEVPDRIEVKVRARQGGAAETQVNADEVLTVFVATRFHR